MFRGRFHDVPYNSTYVPLLPRVSQTSSCFHKTSIRVHGLTFGIYPWEFAPTSMATSMKIILLKFYMEVHGSFHCRWKWKLPLLPSIAQLPRIYSVEVSMSFHMPLHTFTYFHEYHKVGAASTRLTLTLTLTLRWSYLHGSWPTSNFHGSSLLLPWKLELLA